MKFKRIFVIVMDSLGVGSEPDAALYDDEGSNTFGHIAENYQLTIPNLQNLGAANILPLKGVQRVGCPKAYYGIMQEASVGKDTLTGHWEMMGLKIEEPFVTFTDTGFPQELIDELVEKTGHEVMGNYSASGTEIIKKLGEEQIKNGKMIVYTSADSVLQIAAHEKYFGLDELYRCCEIAREITLKPQWKLGRVIARPYVGETAADFTRTANRHDYAIDPYGKTVLNSLKDEGYDVIAVGKIKDIFNNSGITETHKGSSNVDHMNMTMEIAQRDFTGLCFVNLVDFDANWGHRRNVEGYGREIDTFDRQLGQLLPMLKDDDLLILTADHGNDPTWHGTDHTREQVPVIIYNKNFKEPKELPLGDTFANIGMTITKNFMITPPENGISYLGILK